jgi:hippurate hydrolase
VSRNTSPLDSAVVSLCALQAGDMAAYSVIPRQAKLVGTVRSFKHEVQQMLEERLGRLVESVALGFGATASLEYTRVYPATINTAAEAELVADTAEALLGAARVQRDLTPSMGAEDFAFMLQVKPGAYFRLGQGDAACGGGFLHSPRYDFNDEVLPLGAAMFCALAERALAPAQPATT